MNAKRRNFVKTIGTASLLTPFLKYDAIKDLIAFNESSSQQNNQNSNKNDEDFWNFIHSCYTVNPNLLNLNNGGVNPQPKQVQDAFIQYYQLSNEGPTYYMWRILDQGREPLRERLAKEAGVSSDEIAICRNTTEALDTVTFGLDLKPNDEVILTKQDYPNVIQAWKQREMRDGIKLKWINLNLPCENDEEILNKFAEQFTSKTKVINLTHMINWNGQILPARKIIDLAHRNNIEVIVDAAHTFAHIDFKIPDLDCDYFGTSTHKWLGAPFGTGFLYIKKEKISKIWPLFPNTDPKSGDIRKFESQGTRSFPAEMAIGDALNFHQMIGAKRKENRLRFLKDYWAKEIQKIPNAKLLTSLKPEYSCGLGIFTIEGKKPGEISEKLFNKYKIHTTPIEWENISGVRISPNVYTRLIDLDRFIEAVWQISKE